MDKFKAAYNFLKGYRLMIGVAIIFAAKVWDGMNNGHAGDIVGNVLNILGWLPTDGGATISGIAAAAGSAIALFGFWAKVYLAQRQVRNGATVGEALTTKGYVKYYIAQEQKAYDKSENK